MGQGKTRWRQWNINVILVLGDRWDFRDCLCCECTSLCSVGKNPSLFSWFLPSDSITWKKESATGCCCPCGVTGQLPCPSARVSPDVWWLWNWCNWYVHLCLGHKLCEMWDFTVFSLKSQSYVLQSWKNRFNIFQRNVKTQESAWYCSVQVN